MQLPENNVHLSRLKRALFILVMLAICVNSCNNGSSTAEITLPQSYQGWTMKDGNCQRTRCLAVPAIVRPVVSWFKEATGNATFCSEAIELDSTMIACVRLNGALVVLDWNGDILWSRPVLSRFQSHPLSGSVPAFSREGSIYACAEESIVSYSLQGKFQWKYSQNSFFPEDPLVGNNNNVYVGRNQITCIDSLGKLIFSKGFPVSSASSFDRYTLDSNNVAYVCTRDYKLRAYSDGDEFDWIISALHPETNNPVVCMNGNILFSDSKNCALMVDPSGSALWNIELPVDSHIGQVAADLDSNLYLRDYSYIYSYTSLGHLRWQIAGAFASMVIAKSDVLYVIDYDKVLSARNCVDGKLIWNLKLNGQGKAHLSLGSDGTVYVVIQNMGIYAIRNGEE